MPTYSFPQFSVTITDPEIDILMNTIGDKAINQLLSVDILLTTTTAQFGVRMEDMPYNPTWDDSDVSTMVNTKLQEYIVNG
jgi:hypothetical protein